MSGLDNDRDAKLTRMRCISFSSVTVLICAKKDVEGGKRKKKIDFGQFYLKFRKKFFSLIILQYMRKNEEWREIHVPETWQWFIC